MGRIAIVLGLSYDVDSLKHSNFYRRPWWFLIKSSIALALSNAVDSLKHSNYRRPWWYLIKSSTYRYVRLKSWIKRKKGLIRFSMNLFGHLFWPFFHLIGWKWPRHGVGTVEKHLLFIPKGTEASLLYRFQVEKGPSKISDDFCIRVCHHNKYQ